MPWFEARSALTYDQYRNIASLRCSGEAKLVTQHPQKVARVDDSCVHFEDVPSGQPRVIDHRTIQSALEHLTQPLHAGHA